MDTTSTIRTFTDFFRERGHALIEGSTLIPPAGDSVLYTSAGMHPLTPYLLGEPHPLGRRLTGVQRCLRTSDLEEVGDPYHLTVFEMLGSWSLGDYDGPQSQRFGLELLTDGFGLEPGLMHATVFGGDDQVGPDTGAERTWQELGLPVERLTRGQLVVQRPDRAVRSRLGDLRVDRRRAAVRHARHGRALAGAVEPRHDAV